MSGGHYEYQYSRLSMLADEIEKDFINDEKYIGEGYTFDDTWTNPKTIKKEYDYLDGADDEQRKTILDEIHDVILQLKSLSIRTKNLEWFMSGDHGVDTYLKLIQKNENI